MTIEEILETFFGSAVVSITTDQTSQLCTIHVVFANGTVVNFTVGK